MNRLNIKFRSIWNFIKEPYRKEIITIAAALGFYFIFKNLGILSVALPGIHTCALWLFKKKVKKTEKLEDKKRFLRNMLKNQDMEQQGTDSYNEPPRRYLDKTREQKQAHGIDLQEKNDFWEYLSQAKEIFLYEEATDTQKAIAIYKVSQFYAPRYLNFAAHVHSLFKDCLDGFWQYKNDHKDTPKIPNYIEVIYHVIKHRSHQKKGDRNFFDKTNGLSFVDFQLRFSNLSYVNFINENLINANLTRANLINSDSVNADLSNAKLTAANLSEAKLINTNLLEADLSNANLTSSDLTRADLTRAKLTDAKLIRANLTRTKLLNSDLTRGDLTRTDLVHTDLTHANLSYANLTEANLIGTNLSNANLSSANLCDANLSCTDLSHANLLDADLTRTNLIGTDLRDAGNLNKAKLEGALYCRDEELTTLLPEHFNPEKHGMVLANKFGERLR